MKFILSVLLNSLAVISALIAVAGGLMVSGTVLGVFYCLVRVGWRAALELFSKS